MGNLCSCGESTGETQIEIGEPQHGVARRARVREEPAVHPGGGGAADWGGGGGGARHQAAEAVAIRRRWPVGRFGNPEEYRAAEDFVARAMREGNYERDRS
ncbi:hypothetical protein HOY82DRAFT_631470 [Tuber indicum]|nr:hypothetical protein HOY82DRAFT_631470 [Tuber indicum]